MSRVVPLSAKAIALSFSGVLLTTAAYAAPIVVTDVVDVAATQGGGDTSAYSGPNFVNREAGGKHWGDEIATGAQRFDTTTMTVNRNNAASKLAITLRTRFDGTGESSYADLYFDTATPGFDNFGYAIALGNQTQGPGVYAVSSSTTANELWFESGDVYGAYAQLNPSVVGYDPDMAALQYVRLNSGLLFPGYDVTTSRTDVGGGFYDLLVEITSPFGIGLFNDFDLFWATADNGSDSIWGRFVTVPGPGSLALLGAGLMTFAAVRRRKKA